MTRTAEPRMQLPLVPPYIPMEAEAVREIPEGSQWQYEPKWDGFRCLAFRGGGEIYLQSRNARPLGRYFPDVVQSLRDLPAKNFVLDGELVVPIDRKLSFEQLQLRLHPAASRVQKLAGEYPAVFVAFDLLVTDRRVLIVDKPLQERRRRLEAFAERYFAAVPGVQLSPATRDLSAAQGWLNAESLELDGVIAKRLDVPYDSGGRSAVVKVKNLRSVDCVVGGFRYGKGGKRAASLLLGMYNRQGQLDHVGYTSSLSARDFQELTPRLQQLAGQLAGEKGFTVRSPDKPSRWSTERSSEYEALPHELVVEVQYDHVTGDRFRHGTQLLRWRPDKDPAQCRLSQIQPRGDAGELLRGW